MVKDAGDDPDVTDGMTVVAEVEVLERQEAAGPAGPAGPRRPALDGIAFAAGPGVGTVTRAGLQVAPGEPAINPVPRRMIADAVREALPDGALRVTVSIPGGEETARRTFNPRLGIEGGLSVLGTSGRVIPKSEDAWLRSLLPQVDMALAEGQTTLYLAPGGFGERAAREQLGAPEAAIVQCSNFAGDLLDHCADAGVERVVLVGHAGKLVKLAAGIWNTHSRYGDARLETLAALAAAAGAPPTVVTKLLDLPTAEAAAELLAEAGLDDVWDDVADRVVRRAAERVARRAAQKPRCDCAVVAYDGAVLGRSAALRAAPAAAPASRRPCTSPSSASAPAPTSGSRRRRGAPCAPPRSSPAGAGSSSASPRPAPSASSSARAWTTLAAALREPRRPPHRRPRQRRPRVLRDRRDAATPAARTATLDVVPGHQLGAARGGAARPRRGTTWCSPAPTGSTSDGVVAAAAAHPARPGAQRRGAPAAGAGRRARRRRPVAPASPCSSGSASRASASPPATRTPSPPAPSTASPSR